MKFKLIKINCGLLAFCVAYCAFFFSSLNIADSTVSAAATRLLPIYCVNRNDKKISITFDAAWSSEDTQELINILKKYDAKATFFCVGDWVDKNPHCVKAFFDEGHEIANHSDTHLLFSKGTYDQVKKEIESCNKKIEKITGVAPKLCRAPSGDYDNKSIEICEELNMKMIQWDVDSLDWKLPSVEETYSRVTSKVQNGSIVLFHNGIENTPEALDRILRKLKTDGYEFVTVSKLIYWDGYEIDCTGRQKKSEL